MDIYLKSDTFQGNVTATSHEDSVHVHHLNFEVNRAALMNVGNTRNRIPGNPNLSVVSFSKPIDNASNKLFELACNGEVLDQLKFSITRTGSKLESYAEYILHDVMVSHFATTMSEHSPPSENINLSYTRLEVHYLGEQNAPMRSSYDLKQAELV